MSKPYATSNYARVEDDNYQTIDPRCVAALMDCVQIIGRVVDCCAPSGSKIVEEMTKLGIMATGVSDALGDIYADWIVTNPPYKRGLVDQILNRQIERVRCNEVTGFATLMRNNFDFAKSRWDMFTNTLYAGQVHMMFRPWWSEDKKAQPIHNYVWHIWRNDKAFDLPVVLYWRES